MRNWQRGDCISLKCAKPFDNIDCLNTAHLQGHRRVLIRARLYKDRECPIYPPLRIWRAIMFAWTQHTFSNVKFYNVGADHQASNYIECGDEGSRTIARSSPPLSLSFSTNIWCREKISDTCGNWRRDNYLCAPGFSFYYVAKAQWSIAWSLHTYKKPV